MNRTALATYAARALCTASCLILLWALGACSTTGGTLYDEAADSDAKAGGVISFTLGSEESEETAAGQRSGLEIDSQPDEAHVYLDNRYMGLTPLFLEDVEPGRHRLTLKKEGYYSRTEWIDYYGAYASYSIDLERITGLLKITAVPGDAELLIESERFRADRIQELPVGTYTVRIRAFGYRDAQRQVQILERTLTELNVELAEADFFLSELESSRSAFNPRNAGLLGAARISFRVSTYGRGSAVVSDEQGGEVFRTTLSRFTTWDQEFTWNGRGSTGLPLPDGKYTVRVEAIAEKNGTVLHDEIEVRIDSSIVLQFRSLWSGSSGLLYAPSPEVLPGGSIQLSSLVLAHAHAADSGTEVRVPLNLSFRLGIGKAHRFELDTSIGAIVGYYAEEDTFYLPLFASAAFKASLLPPHGGAGGLALGSAVQAKLSYQNVYTDTLANFSGFSLAAPTSLQWGFVSLLFSPEIVISPWYVSYDSEDVPPVGFYSWLYGRLGLLFDLSPLIVGSSLSLRSLPIGPGFDLHYPFQAALEAHWMIPQTQLFVSLALSGEFSPPDSYFLYGGAGLGLLN